jgi:small subunit ribosomal protein S16
MLTIRFNRTGKKNRAQFRVVLQEHTVAPGGRHIEVLGSWDPHLKKGEFKGEKIKEWITKGAQVSDSVWNLLIRQGIIEGKKRSVKINKPVEVKAEEEKEAVAGEKAEEKKESSNTKEPAKVEEKKEETTKEEAKEEAKKEDVKVGEVKKEEIKKEEVKEVAQTEEVKKEEVKPEVPKEEAKAEAKPEDNKE